MRHEKLEPVTEKEFVTPLPSPRRMLLAPVHPSGASALYEMMQGNWDVMYAQYLKTNAWKVRRQEIIDRDVCCRLCASEENLQVHHVDGAYKRIGNELDQDLTTLCRDCHEMYHAHKNNR